MSSTRFNNDAARIKKELAESTFAERYYLNTPGPGLDLPFVEDPQLRMQTWGANLRTNTVNLESDLRGMTRKLCRDDIAKNHYKMNAAQTNAMGFSNLESFVDETRASQPAWLLRGSEQPRWEEPWLNPQANTEKSFVDNVQTRILNKDYFVPKVPSVIGVSEYYLGR
jgi:hypothetical protein